MIPENKTSCDDKGHTWCPVCRPDVFIKVQKARTGQAGHAHTTAFKQRMSISRRGSSNPFFGKKHSIGVRAQMSKSHLGNQSAKEYRHTNQAKLKMSKGVAAAWVRGVFNHKRYNWFRQTSLEYALQMLLESAGLEYDAQKHFGRYAVDFWVPSHRLVFEADGQFWYSHQDKEREIKRDKALLRAGATAVIHLDDNDLAPWATKR